MDDNDQEKEQKLKMKKVKLAKKIKIGLASAPVFFAMTSMFIVIIAVLLITDVIATNSSSSNGNKHQYISLATAYKNCKAIRVNGYSEAIPLEDYVAGVVSHESYSGQNIEAIKAQAVVARTYAISRTNYCTSSIPADTTAQVYNPDLRTDAVQAAEDTAGLVLTYEGKIFSTEYDSFCYNDSDCKYWEENGKRYVTYKKVPSNETHTVSISPNYYGMAAGGHGRGMSQVASYEMAANGSTFEEILAFFYADGSELATIGEYSSGFTADYADGFTIRTAAPNASDKWFNGEYLSNSNRGQCVWYVKGRAQEIIDEAIDDEEVKEKTLTAIKNTYGNAKDWWNNPSLSEFATSTDYTQPHDGSIIIWQYGPGHIYDGDQTNYGHVAIIEHVDEDAGTVTITEGWSNRINSCPNDWGCVTWNTHTYSMNEYYQWAKVYYMNGKPANEFLGYIYLLG